MSADKINRWLSLAANIAVLGGLILVTVQINQSTQIAKAQLINDYYLADMQLELALMGEEPVRSWAKAVYSPDQLTHEDAAVLDRYFNYGLVQILRLQKMDELGLADDDWTTRVNYLDWHLGNEVGRRWWAHARDGYSVELRKTIDDVMKQSDHQTNREWLDAMLPATISKQD